MGGEDNVVRLLLCLELQPGHVEGGVGGVCLCGCGCACACVCLARPPARATHLALRLASPEQRRRTTTTHSRRATPFETWQHTSCDSLPHILYLDPPHIASYRSIRGEMQRPPMLSTPSRSSQPSSNTPQQPPTSSSPSPFNSQQRPFAPPGMNIASQQANSQAAGGASSGASAGSGLPTMGLQGGLGG